MGKGGGVVKHMAKALAVAIAYIDCRTNDFGEAEDIETLEALAAAFHGATTEERRSLACALMDEGRPDLLECLGSDLLEGLELK